MEGMSRKSERSARMAISLEWMNESNEREENENYDQWHIHCKHQVNVNERRSKIMDCQYRIGWKYIHWLSEASGNFKNISQILASIFERKFGMGHLIRTYQINFIVWEREPMLRTLTRNGYSFSLFAIPPDLRRSLKMREGRRNSSPSQIPWGVHAFES